MALLPPRPSRKNRRICVMSSFEPIAVYRCSQTYRYEAPRQGVFADNTGTIEFLPDRNFEEALRDLAGFDRIWVIFEFHLNETWRPKVRPPVAPPGRRIGVFATRSPHRPNRIGLSCVELEKVDGLRLHVRGCDLLDRTPVLDVKPYIPRADSFPDARTGWLETVSPEEWKVEFTPEALADFDFIAAASGLDLAGFCRIQLGIDPLSPERKRLSAEDDGTRTIGCRTWKVRFTADETARRIRVLGAASNYTDEELLPGAPDPYGDKALHRAFRARR